MKHQILVLLCLCPIFMFAQEFRATISGTVSDARGGSIPKANVRATEVRTGTVSEAISDSVGQYSIPFLLPGKYDVTAAVPGFQTFKRSGIELGSGDHPIVDIHMQVGEQSQTVTVTAEVPLVNKVSASFGETTTTKEVEDLPIAARIPLKLAQFSVGVLVEGQVTDTLPGISMGGSKIQGGELLLDGSPNSTWSLAPAYNPPMDVVQQVTVNAFDSDAAYGHTSGGVINQVTKSGTNSFHGSIYEFLQTNKTSANNFFSNSAIPPAPVPTLHYNLYGFTAGGPVLLPRLYDGRNKLFVFAAWEGERDNTPTPTHATVPTLAERNGDFSQLLLLGSNYQIYNPYSGRYTPGSTTTIVRDTFDKNVIPSSLFNPIALAYMKYYPAPNTAGFANGENNYFVNSPTKDASDNEFGRLDYNVGNNDKVFFDLRHNLATQFKNNLFNNIATGSILQRDNWGSSLDEVHTFGGSTVTDLHFNWTRLDESHSQPSAGLDPTALGFPSYLTKNSQHIQMPYIALSNCGNGIGYNCLGDTGANNTPADSFQIFGTVQKVIGNHSLKAGTDIRQYRLSNITYGPASGSFTFGTNWTQSGSSGTASPIGQDLASFLLGLPTAGSYAENAYATLKSYFWGVFLQDDWRFKSNLTLDLGIRFDKDVPQTERYNRMVNGFDTTTPNPIAPAVEAAYAANYAANPSLYPIPPSAFYVNGGLTYASSRNPYVYEAPSNRISPRIGFAWNPQILHDSTVIRGGFGMFVAPITLTNIAANGNISTSAIVSQQGFSQTTAMQTTVNNYLIPVAGQPTLSDPFPSGIQNPVGSSLGLASFLGQSVSLFAPYEKNPYAERWEFDIQRQFGKDLLAEVAYIGNHGVDIPIPQTELNALPRQYLSGSNWRDAANIANANRLSASVPNPFLGLIPNSAYNTSKTISLSQLLAPFPQFPVVINGGALSGGTNGVLVFNNDAGGSWFHSFNARVEKRLSSSLSLRANYMFSKFMERDDYLNDSDYGPEKRVSPFDHPHHISAAATYILPFGTGRKINLSRRWTNALLGGWVLNGIYQWQIGAPIYWTSNVVYCPQPSPACNGFGGPLKLNVTNANGYAFNLGAFDQRSTDQPQDSFRTFSTTFGNLRQQDMNNFDASLLKEFHINEPTYFQLRFEVYNVMNHPVFGAPSVNSPTSNTFGLIQTLANSPRKVQFGARFVW